MPASATLASPDPAAVPGSGPSPPSPWNVNATHTLAVSVAGSDLLVCVDGVNTSRPLASVSGLSVTGAGTLSVTSPAPTDWAFDGHGGVLVTGAGLVPISAAGLTSIAASGPANTLHGPAPNTTWTISGPNSGTVDGLAFSGFENLAGAANNNDTFRFEPGGSLSGLVDGGPGGFDTVVVDGTRGFISSRPIDHSSGALTVDGTPIHYAGMEPVVTSSSSFDVNDAGGTVTVTADATYLYIAAPSMETAQVQISTLTALSIEARTVDIKSGFAIPGASLTITASDTENGSDLGTGLILTGADAQSYIRLSDAALSGGSFSFSATATAKPDTSGTLIGVATINSSPTAEVALLGHSSIVSTGDVTLSATTVETAKAVTKGTGGSAGADAAVAVTTITSTATSHVSGTSYIQATGALVLSALNTVNVTTSGDASQANAGAGIAVAVVSAITKAYIDASGASPTTAASITITADTDASSASTGKASSGGSSSNDKSPNERTKTSKNPGGNANVQGDAGGGTTSSKAIPIAAALAFTYLSDDTEAYISPTSGSNDLQAKAASNSIKVHAASGNATPTVADGSTVAAASSSSSVGVGIAIDIADVTTKAYVGGNAHLEAPVVVVEVPMPSTGTTADAYSAKATSGHGDASKLTVAGSLALTVVNIDRSATLPAGAAVDQSYGTSSHGDLQLTTVSTSTSTAQAVAHKEVFDPATAVGTDNQTITLPYQLKPDGSTDIKSGDPVVYSNGGDTTIGGLVDGGTYWAVVDSSDHKKIKLDGTSQADAKLASPTGIVTLDKSKATGNQHNLAPAGGVNGTGIGASFAINIVNDTTSSSLEDTAALAGAKSLTMHATTTDAMTTEAENGSNGKTAITPVVAISISNVTTHADVGSAPATLTLAGALDAEANQTASVTTTAKGSTQSSSAGVGASIAITSASHNVQSTTSRNITAAGAITFTAIGQSITDSESKAGVSGADDGSSGGDTGSVNDQANHQLGQANSSASANGHSGGDTTTPAATTADSSNGDGSGGSSAVAFAASITFNLVHTTSDASLPEGLTLQAGGLLTLSSSANSDATAKADGEAATQGGSASIGAAVAINRAIVLNQANVGAGTNTTSNGAVLSATMTPVGTPSPDKKHSFDAEATSGASNSTKANISGSLALNIIDVNTTAELLANPVRGPPVKATVNVTGSGDVHMTAESAVDSTTKALAAKQVFDPTVAINSSDNTITLPSELSKADGTAIATGDAVIYRTGGGKPIGVVGDPSHPLVDGMTYYAIVKKPGYIQLDPDQTDAKSASPTKVIKLDKTVTGMGTNQSLELADGGDAKVGIGASVSINLVNDTTQTGTDTTATAADGAAITGAKDLVLSSTDQNSLTTEADGGASGQVAISPSVSVSIANVTTTASLGQGPALTNTGKIDAQAQQTASLDSKASGDVNGSKVGVGISLSLALATDVVDSSSARDLHAGGDISFQALGSSAVTGAAQAAGEGEKPPADSSHNEDVNKKSDAQLTEAKNTQQTNTGKTTATSSTPKATTSDSGGASLSLAAAITINIVTTRSTASFADGSAITTPGKVTLKTSANTDVSAQGKGDSATGAKVGVGAGVAINLVDITNRATTGVSTIGTSTTAVNGLEVDAVMTPLAGGSDTTHAIDAESVSGASDATKVDVAGSFAMNLVANHTEAVVTGGVSTGASVYAGTGDVALTATSNETDTAKAKSTVAGKSGSVGVGASVALNILTPTVVRTQIENNAALHTAHNVDLETTSTRTVATEVEAGTAGGKVGVTPVVALVVLKDDAATASVEPGADLTATGALTVHAVHTATVTTTGNADAAGASVAVGADIAINVVLGWSTTAALNRNASATSVSITAESTMNSSATAKASATGTSGDDKKADDKANGQVNGSNPNTNSLGTGTLPAASTQTDSANSKTDSKAGDKNSGGVDVAASISVNWVVVTNSAQIAPNAHVTATAGAVTVSAKNTTNAAAKSTGVSIPPDLKSITKTSDARVAAAVGLNVQDIHNTATIGAGAHVSGAGITVEAILPSGENDFVVYGIAAAGGRSKASVSGSIGVQVLSFDTEASVGQGAQLTSTQGLTVNATNTIGLTNIAAAGALAVGGTAVGGAIAVNVLPDVTTKAFIDSSATTQTSADVTKALSVTASFTLVPIAPPSLLGIKPPAVSSVAVGASGSTGSGDPAVSGSIIVDVFSITTSAYIAPGAQINQTTAGDTTQTITVTATDHTTLFNLAGALAISGSSAGVGVGIIVDVIDKSVSAYIGSGAKVSAGGDVSVDAHGSQTLTELSVEAAVSPSSVGIAGGFVVVVLNQDGSQPITAYIDGAKVSAGGKLEVAADNTDTFLFLAGNVTFGSSAGIGVAAVILVNSSTVDAHVSSGSDLTAGPGGVAVKATQSENLILIAGAGAAAGGGAAVAGSVVVNTLNDTTHATLDGTTHSGGDVVVRASDTTTSDGVGGQLAIGSSGGVGVGADIEVITKDTRAWIAPSASVTTNTASGANVTLNAISSETVVSVAAGLAFGGSAAVSVNAAVSVYSITTEAKVGNSATVTADGSVGVSADEALKLDIVAGDIAIGGSAGVGVAAGVPVITKNTYATIDDSAHVTGKGNGSGLTVNGASYTVAPVDTRFNGASAVQSDGHTLELGYTHGFKTGDEVIYDSGAAKDGSGATSIGGLTSGHTYFVVVKSPTAVQLVDADPPGPQPATGPNHTELAYNNATSGSPTTIALTAGSGESHRLVPTNQASPPTDSSPRFDPHTDVSGNSLTLPYSLGLTTGAPVVYSSGGGAAIGGLQDGSTYYVIGDTAGAFQLAATKDQATGANGTPVTAITLDKSAATGRSHSLVKQGQTPAADASQEGPRTITHTPTSGFHGVALSATNSDDIATVGVSVAIGGAAGVGVSGTVDVITVNTKAKIGKSAHVNDATTGTASGQSVLVQSGNQFHLLLIAAGLAIGGGAGVSGDVNVAILNLNADSLIDNSAVVHAAQDVVVSATQQAAIVSVTFAAGGGVAGIAGAVAVLLPTTHTWADTGTGVTVGAGNNVAFLARDDSKLIGVAGGIGAGAVGVGAAVSVLSLSKDTEAFIGSSSTVDAAAQGASSLSNISNGTVSGSGFGFGSVHGLAVQAQSSEDIFGLAIAVGAGVVGVAVPVGVTLINVTTKALVHTGAQVNTGTAHSSAQAVNISALDAMKTLTIAGGVGGGFVGVGAAVDVGVANATTSAVIDNGATVDAQAAVDVNALSTKHVTTYALGVGGGFVGVAGSVSVWTLGTTPVTSYGDGQGDNGDTQSTIKNSDGSNATSPDQAADAQTSGSGATRYQGITGGVGGGSTSGIDGNENAQIKSGTNNAHGQIVTATPSGSLTHSSLHPTTVPAGTSATIDGTVNAGGDVNVRAADNVGLGGVVGVAAGGAVGVGASVFVGNIGSATTADIGANADIRTSGALLVSSRLDENTSTVAFAGAAGAVGVAAQVTVLNDTSSQFAHIESGAQVPKALHGIDVSATADRSVGALTIAGAVGAIAAGASFAVVNLHGSTTANVDNASIGQGDTVKSLTVESHDLSSGQATAWGISAGLGVAVAGAVALVTVDPTVSSTLAGGAVITTTGLTSILADGRPQATAVTIGVAVAGGVGVGVSVASAATNENVSATVADGAQISGGSLSVAADRAFPGGSPNSTSTYATAISAGGGLLVGVNGSLALASAGGSVSATVGSNVTFPDGDVTISASTLSRQDAEASGVAVGFVGIGADLATATAGIATSASLGNGVLTSLHRPGALTLQSNGINFDVAVTTAGSGGVVSGNASVATTGDTSTADTSLSGGSTIHAGNVSITSSNTANYSPHSDSTNAAVLGASGAFATNSSNTHAITTVGSGLTIDSTGVVEISSANGFAEAGGTANPADGKLNARAAGGGGITLAGAVSTSSITGTSRVSLGNSITINARSNPLANTASIGIDASSSVFSNDKVDLETGGAINGAGTNSSLTGTVTNLVEVGSYATFFSTQNIGLGTFTTINANQQSSESTWGLAAAGFADATVDITSNETVHVADHGSFTALGLANFRAGEDSTGHSKTQLQGATSAQGYVRGLIAIPGADSETHLRGNTTVTIDAANTILSGMDTTISADPGTPSTSADGTGHGYELGFIPITDGSSDSGSPTSSTVTLNGTVTAGAFHALTINIANNGSLDGFYAGQNAASELPGGIPATWTFDPAFVPLDYIAANFGPDGGGDIAQQGVNHGPVAAFRFGNLFAAGGNAIIKAGSLSGSATVTAYGGPVITVNNASPDYVIFDGTIIVPYTSGGHVVFTGAVQSAPAGIGASENNKDQGGQINLNSTYDGQYGAPLNGPAIIARAEISNLGGNVSIFNKSGSFLQSGTTGIYAQQVNINVPKGVVVINIHGTEFTGGNPLSEWDSYMVYPGGNPHTAIALDNLNVNQFMAYVANAAHPNAASVQALMAAIIGPAGSANAPQTSVYYVGDCVPHGSGVAQGNCDGGHANSLSIINSNSSVNGAGPFASFPVLGLTVTATSFSSANVISSPSGFPPPFDRTSASAIHAGGAIGINADVVDVDGNVIAGPPTDWSVSLPSNLTVPVFGGLLQVSLATYRSLYLAGGVANPVVDIPVSAINPGTDSPIAASYDARTNRITIDKVSASAGAGLVRIKGQIVSTNTLGNIHVNGGLGHVTVDNQTGIPLVMQDVYTGSIASALAATSHVQLIDTHTGVQTLYDYRPGQGTTTYRGGVSDSIQTLEATTPISSTSAASATYQTAAGYRIEWQVSATMTRKTDQCIDTNGHANCWTVSDWAFTTPSDPKNPWQYYNFDTSSTQSADLPYSHLIYQPGLPLFQETISGSAGGGTGWNIFYGGCDGHNGCNDGFHWTTDDNPIDHKPAGEWDYYYPGTATLTLDMSVAADNPIAVTFGGHDRGLIQVTSNAPVFLDGPLTNPNGDTNVTSTGAITQGDALKPSPAIALLLGNGLGNTILTNNLTMTAGGGLGSVSSPISATLTANGVLNATAGAQGIYLSLGTGAVIGQVSAGSPGNYGDVVISAGGSLVRQQTASDGTVNVSGRNVTLLTTVGSVGTLANPLVIAAHPTALVNGGFANGLVNAHAVGDVALIQTGGDLVVGSIASDAGSVYVDVTNGGIFDQRTHTPGQQQASTDAQGVWASLHLTDALGAADNAAATVKAFAAQVERDYQQLWSLRADATGWDPVTKKWTSGSGDTITLTSDGIARLRGATARAMCAAEASKCGTTPSDADVQAYAQGLYTSDAGFFDKNLDPAWRTQSDFTTFNSSYSYTPTDAQKAKLTQNSTWNDSELKYQVNRNALNVPASGGGGTLPPPNISGANVTLIASGSIGRLAAPASISLTDFVNGLSPTQAAALALASAPGDVTLVGIDGNGKTVTFPYATTVDGMGKTVLVTPAGVTATGILVKQTAPLYVASSGAFKAVSNTGAVYVQSTLPDLLLDQVSAAGDASLKTAQNITSAGTSATQVHTGGNLTLVASSGDIAASHAGTTHSPLVINVGGSLISGSAGGLLDLEQTGGDLRFGQVLAGANGYVTVDSGSLLQQASGIGLGAQSLVLTALSGAIGSSALPVTMLLSGTGTLTADAGSSVWISELADPALNSRGDLNISHVYSSAGDVSLNAAGSLLNVAGGPGGSATVVGNTLNLVAGTLATNGSIGALGHDLTIDSRYSTPGAGVVNASSTNGDVYLIETAGDLALGHIAVTSLSGQTAYLVARAGSVLNGSTSGMNVNAPKTWLAASEAIGSSTKALTTSVQNINALASGGGMWIDQTGDVTIGGVTDNTGATPPYGLSAPSGPIVFSAHSTITMNRDVRAGGDITLNSSGGVTLVPNVSIVTPSLLTINADRANLGAAITIQGLISATLTEVHAGNGGDTITLTPQALSGYTQVWGGTGFDSFIVHLPTIDLAHKFDPSVTGPASLINGTQRPRTLYGVAVPQRDMVDLIGGGGGTHYEIDLSGAGTDNVINIHNNGSPAAVNTLVINGAPSQNNTFLLRRNFVALVAPTVADPTVYMPNYERINYDTTTNLLHVVGGLLNNNFFVDDNSAITVLDGGGGYANFQFGQMFGADRQAVATFLSGAGVQTVLPYETVRVAPGYDVTKGTPGVTYEYTGAAPLLSTNLGAINYLDTTQWAPVNAPPSVAPGDEIATVNTTVGWLSLGISYATTAYGGGKDSTFTVYSNKASLKLFGEGGDDTFVVRAFRILGTNKVATSDTLVSGGNGNNHIEYNINAPVSIDGGRGFNTVVVLGTGQGDNFVITKDGVMGAGLFVRYTNVQKVEVDSLGGNSTFTVLSTDPNVVTVLDGGNGHSTFNVAGDVTGQVIALNPDGTSATVNHAVSSTDPAYNGVWAAGLPFSVADASIGQVVVTQPDGGLKLVQDGPSASQTGTYTVALGAGPPTPTTVWYVTVAAAPDASQDGGSSIQISTDGTTWVRTLVLTFDATVAGSWNAQHTIHVRVNAGSVHSDSTIEIMHSVFSTTPVTSSIVGFATIPVNNVDVHITDGDLPGLVATVATTGLHVIEGDRTDSYTLALTKAPLGTEMVTVSLTSDDPRIAFDGQAPNAALTLSFDSSNWNVAQVVHVSATDLAHVVQGERLSRISAVVTSTPGGLYAGGVPDHAVRVDVLDGDSGGVLVLPTGPSVISQTQPSSYTLQLTSAPTSSVTVSILSDGRTLISSGDSRYSATGGQGASPSIVFDASNWNVPASIGVAVNSAKLGQPGISQPVQTFTAQPHTTNAIYGPLVVDGASTAARSLVQGVRLPTETDLPLPKPPPSSSSDPAQRMATLNVFDDGQATGDVGHMGAVSAAEFRALQVLYSPGFKPVNSWEFGQIDGLHMGGPLTFTGQNAPKTGTATFDGGIAYRNIDVVDVLLGSRSTNTATQGLFTVDATLLYAITVIQGGGGYKKLVANGGGGPNSPLILFGNTSQDGTFYNSTTANITGGARVYNDPGRSVIDASRDFKSVIIYGGRGNSTIYGSGSGGRIAGGSGIDEIHAGWGDDLIYGNDGFNLDLSLPLALGASGSHHILSVANFSFHPTSPTADPLIASPSVIYAGEGHDIIIAHHGQVDQELNSIRGTGAVDGAYTVSPEDSGDTTIIGDPSGSAVVLGGSGNETIDLSGGIPLTKQANVVVKNGYVNFAAPDGWISQLAEVGSTDPGLPSNYKVTLGNGNDIVLAGDGLNKINGGNGNKIVFGIDGVITYRGGVPYKIVSRDPQLLAVGEGGQMITLGDGNNVIIGGAGRNQIVAGSGANLVMGANGEVDFDLQGHPMQVQSAFSTFGQDNQITVGNGHGVVIGGPGNNTLNVGPNNAVIANNGTAQWSSAAGRWIITVPPPPPPAPPATTLSVLPPGGGAGAGPGAPFTAKLTVPGPPKLLAIKKAGHPAKHGHGKVSPKHAAKHVQKHGGRTTSPGHRKKHP